MNESVVRLRSNNLIPAEPNPDFRSHPNTMDYDMVSLAMKRYRSRESRLPAVVVWMLVLGTSAVVTEHAVSAADGRTGEQIYTEQCASCHGKQGEGSKEYGHPLVGDKSVGQLAKYIAKSMPEDDPGTCVGEAAD